MLSSSYLASCPDGLVELYSQLENDIITDVAKRLSKLGKVTDATEYQMKIFQELGGLQSDIQSKISKYDTKVQKELLALFDEAIQKSNKTDFAQLNKVGLSDSQQQVLNATAAKTASTGIVTGSKKVQEDVKNGFIKVFAGLQRATMTIASSMSNEFVQQANSAYMKVVTGAYDYKTALKQGVDALASKGAYTVEYTDSGKQIKRSIESMLRTNIMTGINQTASQVTLSNAEKLGCNLVEVSAHLGARPEHAEWQGGIYSLNGEWTSPVTGKTYQDFNTVCKLGDPTGICGINCRHSYYPYFEEIEPEYSNGELSEMKDPKVQYEGKEITQYEAEQKQRAIERNIRKYKRIADAEQIAGLENTQARIKLGEWQSKARDFTQQTGLRRDYSRERIGTKDGRQIKGLKV